MSSAHTTTTTTTVDVLTTAFERAGHAWVLALVGALVVGLGVIVLVAGWHRRTTRNGRHRRESG
jgi:TRAP-type C4-dicarboxylate transport system permease small subunit